METIIGFMRWKKKPGVTIYCIVDGNSYVTGKEAKIRMWSGASSENYLKIDENAIGKQVQFLFTEGFGGQANIFDCQLSK